MPNDDRQRSALSRLADVADQIFDGKSISQYGALCIRASRETGEPLVLLITSRDTGRWVIPKGWGMPKKRPHEVAEREAWEEAGVIGHAAEEPCGFYSYVKSLRKGARAPAIVQVHLLNVKSMDRKFPEKGERSLRWFSPHEAAAAVTEPELKGLLARIPQLIERGFEGS